MTANGKPLHSIAERIICHAPLLSRMIDDVLASLARRPEGFIPSPQDYLASVKYTHPAYVKAEARAKKGGGIMPRILDIMINGDVETKSDLISSLNDAKSEIRTAVQDATNILNGENDRAETYDGRIAGAAWTAELAINRGKYIRKQRRGERSSIDIEIHPIDLRILAIVAMQLSKNTMDESFPKIEISTVNEILSRIQSEPDRTLPKGLGEMTIAMLCDTIRKIEKSDEGNIQYRIVDENDQTTEDPIYSRRSIAIEYHAGTLYASMGDENGQKITNISGRETAISATLPQSVMQSKIGRPLQDIVDHPLLKGLDVKVQNYQTIDPIDDTDVVETVFVHASGKNETVSIPAFPDDVAEGFEAYNLKNCEDDDDKIIHYSYDDNLPVDHEYV